MLEIAERPVQYLFLKKHLTQGPRNFPESNNVANSPKKRWTRGIALEKQEKSRKLQSPKREEEKSWICLVFLSCYRSI